MQMAPIRRDEHAGCETAPASTTPCTVSQRMTRRPSFRTSLLGLVCILALPLVLTLAACGDTAEDQAVPTSTVELAVVEDEPKTVELNVVVDEEVGVLDVGHDDDQDDTNQSDGEASATASGEGDAKGQRDGEATASGEGDAKGQRDDEATASGDQGGTSQQDAQVRQSAESEEPARTDSGTEPTYTYTAWSDEAAPEYYRIVDYAEIATIPEPGTAVYSPLDSLGRSGQAAACVTYDMMEAGRARHRKSLSSISPSGWGDNPEVDIPQANGDIYHGQFWNRSHLIAKSLGGDDIRENLVTGTRMQNVGSNGRYAGGMGYCENLARMWLDDNPDGWLAYVATPVYEGDDLVCRSVIVDMRSSDGSLDVRVEVYNAAKGYTIDYATGAFSPVA